MYGEYVEQRGAKMKLRIVTFNVHFGKNTDLIVGAFARNEILREADIIFLQETEEHESEKISRAKKVADALGLHCVYAPARKIVAKGTHGLAILSKYELSDINIIRLPAYKIGFVVQERIAMTAEARIGNSSARFANVHLDTRLNSAERIAQLKILIDHLERSREEKMILGGDFNMVPFRFWMTIPFSFDNQKQQLHDYLKGEGFSWYCENPAYTFERGFIHFELDGIYTRNVRPLQCGVERSIRVSDHKPIWLDVEID